MEVEREVSSNPLPVEQRPERIVYGAGAVLFTATAVAEIVEVADGAVPATFSEIIKFVPAAGVAAISGYNAVRAYRETAAYDQASEEERNARETLQRRRFVRGQRTTAWLGSSAISGEVAVLQGIKAIQGGSTLREVVAISVSGVAAAVLTKTIPGARRSWRQGKALKALSAEQISE